MSEPQSQLWRIRQGDHEQEVETFEELCRLVRSGRVGRATSVLEPGWTEWVRADEVPALGAEFEKDPWAAWDDLALVAEPGAAEPERAAAPTPAMPAPPGTGGDGTDGEVDDGGDPKQEVDETNAADPKPPGALTTAPVAPILVQPPAGAARKVIAFPAAPSGRHHPTDGTTALDAAEPIELPVPRKPPAVPVFPTRSSPKVRRLRAWPPMLALGLGGVALFAVKWYVETNANAVFEPIRAPSATLPRTADPDPAADVYAEIETDLRDSLLEDVLGVQSSEQFEDDLLIELRRVRLDVVSIDAEVTEWGGRKRDVPQRAAVRIRIRGREGELDRELGAAAMVVGKYVQHYSLALDRFEVVFEGLGDVPLQRDLDGEDSRELYLQRISLADFLESLR